MNPIYRKAALTLVVLSLFVGALFADEEARIALVIGNGDYDTLGRLNNPTNDARDMADALSDIGFDVDLRINTDLESMEEAVVEFGRRLASDRGATGFFFFAGHGVEADGSNYLIPSGATIRSESFLRTRSVATQTVLDEMQNAGAGLSVVVLDACRDNPFSWARSGSRGLAPVGYQPPGSVVAYATSAGSVAEDGTGRNGVFTAELLEHIGTPGIDIGEVFRRTGRGVRDATGGRQVPAVYNQFFDNAYLGGPPADIGGPPADSDEQAAAAGEPTEPTVARPEPTPEPSQRFGFAVDETEVTVSVHAAATIFVDGVEMASLEAGESTTLSGIEVGLRTVAARYPNDHTETTSLTLEAGESAEANFTYGFGSIRVRVETGGMVFLGDVEVGRLSDGQSATLQNVGSGRHEVVVHYDNGERETSRVTVRPDRTVTAEFSRVWGDVRVFAATAGTVFADGEERGQISAGGELIVSAVEGTVAIEYADGERETAEVNVAPDSMVSTRFTRILGDVQVTVVNTGTLFINGVERASVGADDTVTLTEVEDGSVVEMRYENGWIDSETVSIPADGRAILSFGTVPSIGDRGPAGGHIFYVDEDNEFEWTYLEAAPRETEWENKPWGGRDRWVGSSARGTAIGTGAANTEAIVAAYGRREPDSNRFDYPARLCYRLTDGGYDDWFLPSRDELELMYENLHDEGVGGFSSYSYWSSSESTPDSAWAQYFGDGTQNTNLKYNARRVRAIRAF